MTGPNRTGPECAAARLEEEEPGLAEAFGDPTVTNVLLYDILGGKIAIHTIRRHRRATRPDLWPVGVDRCRCERRT